jgi:ankyrin repeat protein
VTVLNNDYELTNRLWQAAAAGDTTTIRMLAQHGVDLDAPDEDGLSAFDIATLHDCGPTARAIQAGREFQYLQKVGMELKRTGNFHNPAAWIHHRA